MEIYGLTRNFELVTANIPYLNLQWNRKYYEAGNFQLQIAAEIYEPSWHYICTHDRPEVGIVQKVEYKNDGGERLILLSGFFAEKVLDEIVCAPRFTKDLSRTENVCKAMFDKYNVQSKKGIVWKANETPLGDRTQSDFIGDKLGSKMYSILETRELSYRVTADDLFTGLTCSVWQGLNRAQSQDENPWQVFSTTWGNIEDETVSIDSSAYANVCVISAADESVQIEVDLSNGGERFETFLDKTRESKKDDQTEAEFYDGLRQEGLEKLADLLTETEIDITNFGSEGYRTDYDLGDMVTAELEDIGVTLETRIVEVSEVFKPSGHTVELGFGTKRITNIQRALIG